MEAIEFASQIQARVSREYEGEIKSRGDTVHVGRISNLTTQTKTAGIGNTVVFEAITEDKQDIAVDTMEYAAFLIEDITEVQANQDLRNKYKNKLGYALARGREVKLAALPQNLSQVVGALGVELSSDDFLRAWQYFADAGLLENSETPGDEFSIFLSPAAYAAALKVDVFINRDYVPGSKAIERAHIGDVYGIPVYMSNLLRAPAGGQHEAFAMHKGCFHLASQKSIVVKSQYLIRNFGDAVAAYSLYGVTELNYPPETPGGGAAVDNRGVLLRSV
jgi:hypothetical protein